MRPGEDAHPGTSEAGRTTTPYLPPGPDASGDWWADDPALRRLLAKGLPPAAWKALEPRAASLGKDAPRRLDALARRADAHGPKLVDGEVVHDESYHELQRAAREHEVFTYSYSGQPRLALFALGYLYAQAECGYYCPGCMTDGAAFVLERHAPPDVRARVVPKLVRGTAEGAMLLTEKRGGSDVGQTETRASRTADGGWTLRGTKWFASNASADVLLTLARMPDAPEGTRGLGLFLLERPNPGIVIAKLKEKLGVRSMATGEIDLLDAPATLLEGGFRSMTEMVNLSRLYNAVASVAIARRALREGQRNATWRSAFGKNLIDQPLYARTLAELANDVRAALLLVFDAAAAMDRGDEPLLRALTPVAKAATGRLAVDAASAACEMLGGNGYVEEWVTPRLLRDAQVLPIWEGTTNVQALDLLRAAQKDDAFAALAADSIRRAPDLESHWLALPPPAQATALRALVRCYHLRAATLLAEDARDGDPDAIAHARAYAARHVERDEAAWDAIFARAGRLLTGVPP